MTDSAELPGGRPGALTNAFRVVGRVAALTWASAAALTAIVLAAASGAAQTVEGALHSARQAPGAGLGDFGLAGAPPRELFFGGPRGVGAAAQDAPTPWLHAPARRAASRGFDAAAERARANAFRAARRPDRTGAGAHRRASRGGGPVAHSSDPDAPPAVEGVSYFEPVADGVFGRGERIFIDVHFSETLTVSGEPRLAIEIGAQTRYAGFNGWQGDTLWFGYTVRPEDRDDDGISVAAGALELDGASVADQDGNNAVLDLGAHARANDADLQVDGALDRAPVVTGLWLHQERDRTYRRGERIGGAIGFSKVVAVTGNPGLRLVIGDVERLAEIRGAGAFDLDFEYHVQADDLDEDGISIPPDAIELDGGAISDLRGNDAVLDLGDHARQDDPDARVDGGIVPPPRVDFHTRPQNGHTYHAGERVEIGIEFPTDVVLSPPYWNSDLQLALRIGDDVRHAELFWHDRRNGIVFVHEVEPGDLDGDGITVAADALVLNGTTLSDRDGNAVDIDLADRAITDDPGQKVDGRVTDTAPAVRLVTFGSRPPSGRTYHAGETVLIDVWFGKNIRVRGDMRLDIRVGERVRQARQRTTCEDHCRAVRFGYKVRETDLDPDGISIEASALTAHGGWIRDRYGNAADLDMAAHGIAHAPGHLVDGAFDPRPRPSGVWLQGGVNGVVGPGERITITVVFPEPVVVRGTPLLRFAIGGETRMATYRNTWVLGPAFVYLYFDYRVGPDDAGSFGLPAGDPIVVGGTIQDHAGQSADLSPPPFHGLGGYSVDATPDTEAPVVTGATVTASRGGETLAAGEAVRQNDLLSVVIEFDEYVELDAPATLTFRIGERSFDVPSGSVSRLLMGDGYGISFRYVVQPEDDGPLSLARDALALASGTTLRDGAGNAAELDLGNHAIAAGDGLTVSGGRADAPPSLITVTGYATPDPHGGDTLGRGERMVFFVEFDEPVMVDTAAGDPALELVLGTRKRTFAFGGFATTLDHHRYLMFEYYIQPSDYFTSVRDPVIVLNGATIRDVAGNDASLDAPAEVGLFLFGAVAGDGALPRPPYARVESKSFVFTELATGTGPDLAFGGGEPIDIPIYYSEPVIVTGAPTLPFTMGGEVRRAEFAGGGGTRRLLFRYRTRAEDLGNLDLPYTEIEVNGGTITGFGGDAAALRVPGMFTAIVGVHYANGALPVDAGSVAGFAEIPDRGLRRVVEGALGRAAGAPVSAADLAGIAALEARDAAIADLTGLQLARRLETLDLANNAVSDLSPLAMLTHLSRLDLSNNRVRDIGPLLAVSGLGSGAEIYLHGNPLDGASVDADIAALRSRGVLVYVVDASLSAASGSEGGSLEFTARLTAAMTEDVDLRWAAFSGAAETAVAGEDYPADQAGTVTVRAGDTTAAFNVLTNADSAAEAHETLRVRLAEAAGGLPEGVSLLRPEGLGLIVEPGTPAAHVPLFPSAGHATREGFVRVVNRGGQGVVHMDAVDDTGHRATNTLAIGAAATVHFNSTDMEAGNFSKGLAGATGAGSGDWRLELRGVDVDVLAYMRTRDGFVTSLHDLVAAGPAGYRVPIFNPGRNRDQVSWLRLFNPGDAAAAVTVTGVDDSGASSSGQVELELAAGASRTILSQDLESGMGLAGRLGEGTGKWELLVTADRPIGVASLLESPTGHVTNLSTRPDHGEAGADGAVHHVPLFPSASDPASRQGFVRVVNRGAAGTVSVNAYDESEWSYDPVTLEIGGAQTVHFNSSDLELGNAAKGLAAGTGSGTGDWRLELVSSLDLDVLAYIRRTEDGFLTSMHDVAPSVDGAWRVPFFNPARNRNQVSLLRLVNPGADIAEVTVRGIDDSGAESSGLVRLLVPAGGARTLTAHALESGARGLSGRLGAGRGKWRLVVESDRPLLVMSLLRSPTGHLTNLSTWRE